MNLSADDLRRLIRLELRPIYVGVERRVVMAAIGDDMSNLRDVIATREDGSLRDAADTLGTWLLHPEDVDSTRSS